MLGDANKDSGIGIGVGCACRNGFVCAQAVACDETDSGLGVHAATALCTRKLLHVMKLLVGWSQRRQ